MMFMTTMTIAIFIVSAYTLYNFGNNGHKDELCFLHYPKDPSTQMLPTLGLKSLQILPTLGYLDP